MGLRSREEIALVALVIALIAVPGLADVSREIVVQLFAFVAESVHLEVTNFTIVVVAAVVALGSLSVLMRRGRW